MPQISPHAIVEDSAKLAADVTVGAFSYIGPDVEIAAGCVIENNVTITGQTTIGEKSHIFPMAVIGTSSNGGARGSCCLGEANTIREQVTIYTAPGQETRIGNDNLVMIGCIIAAGAKIADHGIFDNCSHIGAGAIVGDYVRTSGFACIERGMAVGAYSFVTGYTSVDCDAPPFARVQGSPMRVRGVNMPNLKRCGFDNEDIGAIKKAFRNLFNGSEEFANRKVLAKLLKSNTNPHVQQLAEAVQVALAKKEQ